MAGALLSCLAVGSGTGVVGIVCGVVMAPKSLIISDQLSQLPLMTANMAAAKDKFPEAQWGNVSIQEFDWSQLPPSLSPPAPFDFIVASDCVWPKIDNSHFIRALLAVTDAHTQIILAYEYRGESCRETFFKRAEEFFTFTRIPDTELHQNFQVDDIEVYTMMRKKS